MVHFGTVLVHCCTVMVRHCGLVQYSLDQALQCRGYAFLLVLLVSVLMVLVGVDGVGFCWLLLVVVDGVGW